MLSSDILEDQFGPTHVRVLYQDENERIIQTLKNSSDKILEVSWVKFSDDSATLFPEVHSRIMGGESMGSSFRDAGVKFVRKPLSTTKLKLPTSLSDTFKADGLSTVVEVDIYVGEGEQLYCKILETYSPLVNWPAHTNAATKELENKIEAFSAHLMKLQ